ncbi:DUF1648 domain-containing protein [Leifsonia aquatica]|uniref:DUF1648 domain-containing protein n=1 Tax=Leifsonia aquatica TaxID=144185 RepID=UPI000469F79D|nr:DUF1648 domain-containing protein [Leifsonia aquatica]
MTSPDRRTDAPDALRPDRAVGRFALVALGIPAVLTAAAVALQLAALPDLPDRIATHWGASGAADRFAAAWTMPVLTAAIGLGLPALLSLFALPGLTRGSRGPSYRLLGAVASGLSALIAVLATGSTLLQRGLTDAQDAPAIWLPLIAGFAAGAAVGVAGWFLQPAEPTPAPTALAAEPLTVGSTERAVWTSETAIAPLGGALLGIAVLGLGVASTCVWIFAADAAVAWLLTAVTALLALLAATTLVFRVRADATGLTVSSAVGLPRFHLPLAEIGSVRGVSVDPMGEFGGWGMRLAPGRRFGVVLRRGPAIEVERTDGRRFVVTAPDAATGAALLRALGDRGRTAPDGRRR